MKESETALKLTEADLIACMDYLHGDVVDKAYYEAACCYEYGRESRTLNKAASLSKSMPAADLWRISSEIETELKRETWFEQMEWCLIWRCPSFPQTGWNDLSKDERGEIQWNFPENKLSPLHMMQARHLEVMGTLEKLKALTQQLGWGVFRLPDPTIDGRKGAVAPMVDRGQYVDALFTLNFANTKRKLLQEFGKWLDQPTIHERFKKYKDRATEGIGKTGRFKDRLKDLAAWRLYRERGADGALDFAQKNRKTDRSGKPRPFHDPRAGQSQKVPLNQAPLYSEESGFQKAKGRAEKHLVSLMPVQFDKTSEREFKERVAAYFEEISKSSS